MPKTRNKIKLAKSNAKDSSKKEQCAEINHGQSPTSSLLYLSVAVEGRRILNSKNPHSWRSFTRRCIHQTHKHNIWLACSHHKNNSGEKQSIISDHSYGNLKEIAENSDFKNREETLIRDDFITNIINAEIQKKLLKQTMEPRKHLELAINMEIGMGNQHQNQTRNNTLFLVSVNAIQYSPSTHSSNWSLSNNFHRQGNRPPPHYCSKCGASWLPGHKDKCIAEGKTCNNWSLLSQFAKVFRKQKTQKGQNPKTKNLSTQ